MLYVHKPLRVRLHTNYLENQQTNVHRKIVFQQANHTVNRKIIRMQYKSINYYMEYMKKFYGSFETIDIFNLAVILARIPTITELYIHVLR